MTNPSHDATFFVQIEPEWSNWSSADGTRALYSIKAVSMTQKRPARQKSGTALVSLTVRIPDAAFLPLRPEVVVVIPESMVVTEPIHVEATDPAVES